MFIQTETTPNPNSLKFIPGKVVSNGGSFEITKKDDVKNELIRNILSKLVRLIQISFGLKRKIVGKKKSYTVFCG
mgnify:CR=1 FL=1